MRSEEVNRVIHDTLLGHIRHRKRVSPTLDAYTAVVEIDGNSIDLDLYSDQELEIQPTIQRAKKIVRDYLKIANSAREFFQVRFLPRYNETWRLSDASEADVTLFEQMCLFNIIITADGKATFVYDAGELLGGHLLWLYADEELQFVRYDTPG